MKSVVGQVALLVLRPVLCLLALVGHPVRAAMALGAVLLVAASDSSSTDSTTPACVVGVAAVLGVVLVAPRAPYAWIAWNRVCGALELKGGRWTAPGERFRKRGLRLLVVQAGSVVLMAAVAVWIGVSGGPPTLPFVGGEALQSWPNAVAAVAVIAGIVAVVGGLPYKVRPGPPRELTVKLGAGVALLLLVAAMVVEPFEVSEACRYGLLAVVLSGLLLWGWTCRVWSLLAIAVIGVTVGGLTACLAARPYLEDWSLAIALGLTAFLSQLAVAWLPVPTTLEEHPRRLTKVKAAGPAVQS